MFVVPEGLAAPFVSGSSGQPVLIVWATPLSPNGVILTYRVERRLRTDDSTLVTIATLPGSTSALVFGDQTNNPFTEYSYRVVAVNSAGGVASDFTPFLTPEAGILHVVVVKHPLLVIYALFHSPSS